MTNGTTQMAAPQSCGADLIERAAGAGQYFTCDMSGCQERAIFGGREDAGMRCATHHHDGHRRVLTNLSVVGPMPALLRRIAQECGDEGMAAFTEAALVGGHPRTAEGQFACRKGGAAL